MFNIGDKVKVNTFGPSNYMDKIGVIKENFTKDFNDKWVVDFNGNSYLFFTKELTKIEESKPFKVGDKIVGEYSGEYIIKYIFKCGKFAVIEDCEDGVELTAYLKNYKHYIENLKPKFKIGQIVYHGYNYYRIKEILYCKEYGFAYICDVKFIGKDYTYNQSHKFYEHNIEFCKNDKINEEIIISDDKFSVYKGDK